MYESYSAIPAEVFHYTKKSTALEKILFDKKIKISQFEFTNDPRETKERLFHFISLGDEHKDATDRIRRETVRIIKQEWKVFCVSQHHPKLNPPHASILDTHEVLNPNDSSSLYFNTFMAGSYRPRMWAQYAENHQGLCIKFNGVKLDNRIRDQLGGSCKICCGEVIYSDQWLLEPLMVDLDKFLESDHLTRELRSYILKKYERLFLLKAKDRETEYEFRWLVYSEKNSAEYVSIEGVIEEVLVGVDFPKAYEPSLIRMCQELKVPAGRMIWVNGVPYLEPEIIYQP
jgi:hypothetical protein